MSRWLPAQMQAVLFRYDGQAATSFPQNMWRGRAPRESWRRNPASMS
jgi:hypothetical protein